jgi:hybrid cluster-associated redox disulfide protein
MDKQLQIDKNTAIEDLIEENPEMNDVLYEYGLYCGNCFAAGWDTLEEGAKMHGLEDDEIEELIGELQRKADEVKNTAKAEKITTNKE